MANVLLSPLYSDVYGEPFSSGDFSKRMKMQKLIYLLQEAGIIIGDYNFYWYKHGPYSQQLQNDILSTNTSKLYHINYSENANRIVSSIRNIINESNEYPTDVWAECLASLQYLRTNIFSINSSDDEIFRELKKRKPHLNNEDANKTALRELKALF